MVQKMTMLFQIAFFGHVRSCQLQTMKVSSSHLTIMKLHMKELDFGTNFVTVYAWAMLIIQFSKVFT